MGKAVHAEATAVFPYLDHKNSHQYVLRHATKATAHCFDRRNPGAVRSASRPTLAFALESLPEKLRLPLVLCYSEGMSYAEIAETMRLPLTTVRSRIHYAKKELRKELDAE